MDPQKIGKLISSMRKEKNMTQDELAEKVGVNGRTISKWERGINLPTYDNLEYLSLALGITINELMNGEEDSKNEKSEKSSHERIKYYINMAKKKYLIIIFLTTLLLLASFLGIFFINNYNKNKVYSMTTLNKDYVINGYLVLTPKQNLIMINNINYQGENSGTIDEPYIRDLKIFLLVDDKQILSYTKNYANQEDYLSNILDEVTIILDEDKKHNTNVITYAIWKENVKLVMEYIDINDNTSKIELPLTLNEIFASNKLIY